MSSRRCLVDTHVLLWALGSPEELSAEARGYLADPKTLAYVSFGSLWEISIKASLGKIEIPDDFQSVITRSGYELLNLSLEHLEAYRKLPLLHRDPFDRLLVAQARFERLTLVTRDPEIQAYSGLEFVLA